MRLERWNGGSYAGFTIAVRGLFVEDVDRDGNEAVEVRQ